jgi:large subunit ribosomal protein L15
MSETIILRSPKNNRKNKKIAGRGYGSGKGGTCGRGHDGQKSRSGGGVRPGFEGGQMPLYRRIARKGFSNARFKKEYLIIHIGDIEKKYKDAEEVNESTLYEKGIIKKKNMPVKLLADGELTKKIAVKLDKVSKAAVKKIKKAGGEILEKTKKEKGTE